MAAAPLAQEWLHGPWRCPVNHSSAEAGSIHNPATAQALGFRGGAVAGSIHLEQFLPLLEQRLGQRWQRTGCISMGFRQASIDGEPVRASVAVQPNAQGQWALAMHTQKGLLVMDGSATASADAQGAVRRWLQRCKPGAPARMLAAVPVGLALGPLPARVRMADITRRLTDITEPRPEFTDATRFGGCVAPLSAAVHALRVLESALPLAGGPFVGLFGAIEWQYLNGPVLADHDYTASGRVLAITDSPRSEMLWLASTLYDPATGTDVARMLMLSRLLKNSSPLWTTTDSP